MDYHNHCKFGEVRTPALRWQSKQFPIDFIKIKEYTRYYYHKLPRGVGVGELFG